MAKVPTVLATYLTRNPAFDPLRASPGVSTIPRVNQTNRDPSTLNDPSLSVFFAPLGAEYSRPSPVSEVRMTFQQYPARSAWD